MAVKSPFWKRAFCFAFCEFFTKPVFNKRLCVCIYDFLGIKKKIKRELNGKDGGLPNVKPFLFKPQKAMHKYPKHNVWIRKNIVSRLAPLLIASHITATMVQIFSLIFGAILTVVLKIILPYVNLGQSLGGF